MIIDTHIHLDDKRYQDDLDEVLKRAYENDVRYFIIPAADININEKWGQRFTFN